MNTMTMANALKAVFGAQTLTTASYFPACAQDGTPSGVISAANLASVLGAAKPTFSNAFVVYMRGSFVAFGQPQSAKDHIADAVGVGIIDGGRTIIVAKDAANLRFANTNIAGGTSLVANQELAMEDFDGRTKTSTIFNTLGDNGPAAKYCVDYCPSNLSSGKLTATYWWLPSIGEIGIIRAHQNEINWILNIIGGTPLSGKMWSSTEGNTNEFAWAFDDYVDYYAKNIAYEVRPVSRLC